MPGTQWALSEGWMKELRGQHLCFPCRGVRGRQVTEEQAGLWSPREDGGCDLRAAKPLASPTTGLWSAALARERQEINSYTLLCIKELSCKDIQPWEYSHYFTVTLFFIFSSLFYIGG